MSRQLLGWNSRASECLPASKIHYVWSAYMFSTLPKRKKKRDKARAINGTHTFTLKKEDHLQTIQNPTTSAEDQCLLFLLCSSRLCLVIYSAFHWINSQIRDIEPNEHVFALCFTLKQIGAQPTNNTPNVKRAKKVKRKCKNLVVDCGNLPGILQRQNMVHIWHFQSQLVNIHLCDGPGEFVNTRQFRLGKMSRVYSRLFLSDFADKRHHLQQPFSGVRDV